MKLSNIKLTTYFLSMLLASTSFVDASSSGRRKTTVSVPSSAQSSAMRDDAYFEIEKNKLWPLLQQKTSQFVNEANARLGTSGSSQQNRTDGFSFERGRIGALIDENISLALDSFKSKKVTLASFKLSILQRIDQENERLSNPQNRADADDIRNSLSKLQVVLNDIQHIERVAQYVDARKVSETLTRDDLLGAYMLLYSYISMPGSIVNIMMMNASTSDDSEIVSRDVFLNHLHNEGQIEEREHINASLIRCPDNAVIGRRVKELMPYFSGISFEEGLIKDPVSGDQKELAKIKLNGKWWNVFAFDLKRDSGPSGYYSAGMYNPAQEFFRNAVRQLVAPYALRFGKTVDALMAERDVSESRYDTGTMQYTPIVQRESIEAKKMKECLTSPDSGGILWKRDTSFGDGLDQNMCTYVASTFTAGGLVSGSGTGTMSAQVWAPSGQRINYTFVLEPTNEAPALETRTNSFINRVYAQRRSYHMRNKNLMQYNVAREDDDVTAKDKMVGEFKERIARDRIYQAQGNAYRVYGRVYGVTPSRIYQATRNMSEALDRDQIDDLTSDDFNNRVYAYDYRRTYGPHYIRTYLSESFDGVGTNTTAATVNQDAHAQAQYRAEVALRDAQK